MRKSSYCRSFFYLRVQRGGEAEATPLRVKQRGVNRVKRIKAACICQTLHFQLKDDLPRDEAARKVREEVAHYKKGLEQNRTAYKLICEETQEDGSVMMKIIKQYNACPVGDYLK